MKNTRLILLLLIFLINFKTVIADESFNQWLDSFKIRAVKSGVSKETVDLVMDNAIFLPKRFAFMELTPILAPDALMRKEFVFQIVPSFHPLQHEVVCNQYQVISLQLKVYD